MYFWNQHKIFHRLQKKNLKKKYFLLFDPLRRFFQVLSTKLTSSWLRTGSIEISVEFYIDFKKKIWKKNTFCVFDLDPVFCCFRHEDDVQETRDRFHWNQRPILHRLQKKNLKKFYFSKIPIYSTWANSEAFCDLHGPWSSLKPNFASPTHRALSKYTPLGLLPGSEQGDLDVDHINTYRNGPANII